MAVAESILQPKLMPVEAAVLLAGSPATSGARRRALVGVTLVGADLASGYAATQLSRLITGATFVVGSAALPALIVVFWVAGLYDGFGPCPYGRLRLRVQGILLLGVVDFATNVMVAGAPRPGFLVLTCVLLLLCGYYVELYARTVLIRHGLWGAGAVFVGAAPHTFQLARYLLGHPEFGLRPLGFVDDEEKGNLSLPAGLVALGPVAILENIMPKVEVLVYRSAAEVAAVSPGLRRSLNARQIIMIGDSYDLPSLWLRTRSLGGLIGVELRSNTKKWNRRVKRFLDLLIAIPACVMAAPIIGLAALAVKFVDPGPAFYIQERIGINGSTIRVCKLRTMYTDAEARLQEHLARDPQARLEWERFFKLRSDPRILPGIGRLLRRSSIDELPQLWHVVSGDMSLVGPRPFPSYHMASFDNAFQAIRCSVSPGLSGLWQVTGRSDGGLDVQRAEDLYYILNWSIWLDIYIIMETPVVVLAARGAR